MEKLTLIPYFLLIGVIPTILLGTLFFGIFEVNFDDQKYMGVKVAFISVILGSIIAQFL